MLRDERKVRQGQERTTCISSVVRSKSRRVEDNSDDYTGTAQCALLPHHSKFDAVLPASICRLSIVRMIQDAVASRVMSLVSNASEAKPKQSPTDRVQQRRLASTCERCHLFW